MGFRVVPPYKVGLSGDGGQLGGVEWVPPIKWGRVPPPPAYNKRVHSTPPSKMQKNEYLIKNAPLYIYKKKPI